MEEETCVEQIAGNIKMELDKQSMLIEDMNSLIGALAKKLKPVIYNNEEVESYSGQPTSPKSQIAEIIENNSERIKYLATDINALIKSIDL